MGKMIVSENAFYLQETKGVFGCEVNSSQPK